MSQLLQLLAIACIVPWLAHASESDECPPPNHDVIEEAYASVDSFAWSLFDEARSAAGGDNVFMSPVSVALAVQMLRLGARGNTAAQIDSAMPSVGNAAEDAGAAFQHLIEDVNNGSGDYNLSTANAIYVEKHMEVLAQYSNMIKRCMESEAHMVDFRQNHEGVRGEINQWVEDQTNDKIKDLLAKGTLDVNTRMVLVNAIYFKGEWDKVFTYVYKDTFTTNVDDKQQVEFMSRVGHYAYYDNAVEPVRVLSVPYKGGKLSMHIILPRPGVDMDTLDSGKVQRWIKGRHTRKVEVHIPKFTMTQGVDLKKLFEALNITDVFDSEMADLSGITANTPPLYTTGAVHKAFIAVDERGTEAAAATAIVNGMMSALHEPPPVFKADRPFMFVIARDQAEAGSKLVLFYGVLNRV